MRSVGLRVETGHGDCTNKEAVRGGRVRSIVSHGTLRLRPVLNIVGDNFPAWLVCALAGALLAALMRPLFLTVRIEAYLWPLPLVYLSLGVLLACLMYLLFFNRI